MNNKEFEKLLKEWKQKNKEDVLEEGIVDKLAPIALSAIMSLAANANPPSPQTPDSAQVQVQKKELKDLKSLSEHQKYIVGIYIQSLENSMSNNIEQAVKKLQGLRGLIDNGVQLDEKTIQMIEDKKQKDLELYKEAVKLAENSIANEVRYVVDLQGGTEIINKMQKQISPKDKNPAVYGSKAFDTQQAKK